MNRILRIETGKAGPPRTWSEPVGEYVGLGGRAMVSRIIRSEVPPGSSPLGPDNKVVMAPGLMGGFADCAESLSMGCKSPLTNCLNLAMCGGAAGDALARLGYAAVVVQGRDSVDGLYTVIISKGGVRSEPAEDLRALCARDMAERLRARHGRGVSVIGLGPAGKRRMASAAISVIPPGAKTAPCIGRGGDGAVLETKGVKAIVLDASGAPPRQPVRPGRFVSACRRFKKELSRPAAVPSGPADDNAPPPPAGSLPPRERAALAMGLLHQKEASRAVHPALALFPDCLGCGDGPCPNLLDGQGTDDLRPPGVDAVFVFGQGCGLKIEAVSRLDALCADYGFDPMEVDTDLRVAIQAGQLRRDDPDRVLEIVRGIGQGTISRRMSGAGATKVATRCGVDRDMPNLDEMRVALASGLQPDKAQAELACSLMVVAMTLEMVGCCPYLSFAVLNRPGAFRAVSDAVNAALGLNASLDDLIALSKEALRLEREFNLQARRESGGERPLPHAPVVPRKHSGSCSTLWDQNGNAPMKAETDRVGGLAAVPGSPGRTSGEDASTRRTKGDEGDD